MITSTGLVIELVLVFALGLAAIDHPDKAAVAGHLLRSHHALLNVVAIDLHVLSAISFGRNAAFPNVKGRYKVLRHNS